MSKRRRAPQAPRVPPPEAGCQILYHDPATGSAGHTGRLVAQPRAGVWRIVPVGWDHARRIPVHCVRSYWKRGILKHTLDRLVPVTP